MSRYKQSLLSLCWLLLFSVGFLSVGSLRTYAYSPAVDNSWTLQSNSWRLKFFDADGNKTFENSSAITIISSENRYHFTNGAKSSGVYGLTFGHENYQFDFPYMPELYDYYIYVTVHSAGGTTGDYFSFVPERATIDEKDCSSGVIEQHYLETIVVRHYDDNNQVGFVYLGKLPDNIHNGAMRYFNFYDWGGGSVGANLYVAGLVIAVDKTGADGDLSGLIAKLDQIINKIDNQTTHLTHMLPNIQKQIIEQYAMSENEDFGVGDITDDVEEKLGVLSFTTDTMISFLDLFASTNASTELTFPGFSMAVGNEKTVYEIWPDITYDLTELESRFPTLIATLRTMTVLSVWLAVFRYLGKAYEHFINKR